MDIPLTTTLSDPGEARPQSRPQPAQPSPSSPSLQGPISTPKPILIVGAGLIGLTLAISLQTHSIPYRIFDRDTSPDSSPAGWGVTLHWALPDLQKLIPAHLFQRLKDVQVDPEHGVDGGDEGRFLFLDLRTMEVAFEIERTRRVRVNRRGFRGLLLDGLEGNSCNGSGGGDGDGDGNENGIKTGVESVHWGKTFKNFEILNGPNGTDGDGGVRVTFDDGSVVEGSMLIGADGAGSRVRRQLLGDEAGRLSDVPVRILGVTLKLTPDEARPLLNVDPLMFQGSCPETGRYLWFSTLSTPRMNGSVGKGGADRVGDGDGGEDGYYECQLLISWVVTDNATSKDTTNAASNINNTNPIPPSNAARLALMKSYASTFHPTLRTIINAIPPSHPVQVISLADFAPPQDPWDNHDGRVTLAGDAAHAMTMYRGEGLNYGLVDAVELVGAVKEWWSSVRGGKERREKREGGGQVGKTSDEVRKEVISLYEERMRARTRGAVLNSRRAAIEAHDLHGLTEESPVIRPRRRLA